MFGQHKEKGEVMLGLRIFFTIELFRRCSIHIGKVHDIDN